MSARARGFTLMELLVALVMTGILGVTIVRLLVSTSRFYGQDAARRNARAVSRSALALMESELRMVEVGTGIVSADSFNLTVKVPYALGVLCTSGATTATVSLLPVDSLEFANAGFSGYSYRDSTGNYTDRGAGVSLGTGVATTCTGASLTPLTGSRIITLNPAPPATVAIGSAVLLYQQLTYRFGASTAVTGRTGLWRTVAATGVSEEIAAPFDASARFRFFVLDADTSQAAAPATLSNTRGIGLVLTGASEKTPLGRSAPLTAPLTTAIFFHNRAQ